VCFIIVIIISSAAAAVVSVTHQAIASSLNAPNHICPITLLVCFLQHAVLTPANVLRLKVLWSSWATISVQIWSHPLLSHRLVVVCLLFISLAAPGADSSKLIEAASSEGVMVIPGHLISVPHLEAAARSRQQQQQQQQQQRKAADNSSLVSSTDLQQLQDQQQQQQQQAEQLAPSPYFRVSFVSVGPDAIKEGIKRLAKAIAAISSSSSSVNVAAANQEGECTQVLQERSDTVEREAEQELSNTAAADADVDLVAAAPLVAADAVDVVSAGSAASAAQLVAAAAASAAAAAAASYGKGGVSLVAGVRVWR
jgi:hypothetical protein